MDYLPDRIKMTVKDNGQGFILEKESDTAIKNGRLGLIGMRERAHLINADFKILSRPGQGTTVAIELKTPKERPVPARNWKAPG
jgi:signal transduction histidine kinase